MAGNQQILYTPINPCLKIHLDGTSHLLLGDIHHLDIHFLKTKDLELEKIIILMLLNLNFHPQDLHYHVLLEKIKKSQYHKLS